MVRTTYLRVAAVGMAALALMGQATPDRFDLTCPGDIQTELNGLRSPQTKRIRIDLVSRQWCFDECSNVQPLAAVTATEITLFDIDTREPRRQSMARGRINRVTGEYRNLQIEARPLQIYREERGECTPSPFSGFPQARF
jgi:hypothetical protein